MTQKENLSRQHCQRKTDVNANNRRGKQKYHVPCEI